MRALHHHLVTSVTLTVIAIDASVGTECRSACSTHANPSILRLWLQAARAKAEELMQQAIEGELTSKEALEAAHAAAADADDTLAHDRDKARIRILIIDVAC